MKSGVGKRVWGKLRVKACGIDKLLMRKWSKLSDKLNVNGNRSIEWVNVYKKLWGKIERLVGGLWSKYMLRKIWR